MWIVYVFQPTCTHKNDKNHFKVSQQWSILTVSTTVHEKYHKISTCPANHIVWKNLKNCNIDFKISTRPASIFTRQCYKRSGMYVPCTVLTSGYSSDSLQKIWVLLGLDTRTLSSRSLWSGLLSLLCLSALHRSPELKKHKMINEKKNEIKIVFT